MKKVKQLNGWVIKKYNENDVSEHLVKEGKLYNIFSPQGIFLEEKLTFQQAIEFAEENSDNVQTLRKAKLSKEEFLLFIEQGLWFQDGKLYVGYMEYDRERDEIIALYLSSDDPEGMSFCTYSTASQQWDWDEEKQAFRTLGAGVYHFGTTDVADKYSIYNIDTYDDATVNVEKLVKVIIESGENERYNIVQPNQLRYIWEQLSKGNIETLRFRPLTITQ